MLRHQQKLHSQVSRRSLLPNAPTSAPASNGTQPESSQSTPSNDHIIVLHNNTHAKAPLPDSRTLSPLGMQMPNLTALSPAKHMVTSPSTGNNVQFRSSLSAYGTYDANGLPKHNMPSPNINLSLNTPLANLNSTTTQLQLRRASHAVDPTQSTITQQPSPVTGDSPDLKDKKVGSNWLLNFSDETAKANLKQFSHLQHLEQNGHPQYRHASFSAVSGASYTNLKDALAIQSHQFADVPQQVGFATPQHTAAEIDSKGLSSLDFGNLADWYGDEVANKGDFMELASDLELTHPTLQPKNPTSAQSVGRQGFQTRLNTIPSESQLAGNNDMFDMNYYTSQIHQFNSPSHPHYIKDNALLNLGLPTSLDGQLDLLGATNNGGALDGQHSSSSPSLVQPPQKDNSKESDSSSSDKASKSKAARQPQIRKHKSSSVSLDKDFKRAKLGFVNDTANLDWVNEIMAVPVAQEFPQASHETGFMSMPYLNNNHLPDEVLTLFKHRQDDLVKQRSLVNTAEVADIQTGRLSQPMSRAPSSKVQFTIGDGPQQDCVTKELRDRIILISNMSDSQFPPLDDLNSYMSLYESEFNTYFPFIHMPSLRNPMVDNFENIPLILSMCAIGALYSYHDSNSLLLFNLSKYHIHNFFEKEVTADKLHQRKVPLMAHQSLVLHIFISMFLNEPNMLEITTKQMNSMVGLIRSTNFHRPLDQFLIPPPAIKSETELGTIQNNYDYFIMAQTRIRTILCFYELEVIRSCLLGSPMPMSGTELLSGTPCIDELLYKADNSRDWYHRYLMSESKDLVKLTNNTGLNDLFQQLVKQYPLSLKLPFQTLLVLLMFVHEMISKEWKSHGENMSLFRWRTRSKPILENLLESWEVLFAKNGGFFKVNSYNRHLLNEHKELQMILPLLLLARLRLCVNITPVTEKVLQKDWMLMSNLLNRLEDDADALKAAATHALEILRIWAHNISLLSDSKQVSVRTPVFFVTCIFAAMLVLQKALHSLEKQGTLSVRDRVFWLECEAVLTTVERTLSPNEDSESYSEFLRKLSQGVFDFVLSKSFKTNVNTAIGFANSDDMENFDKAIGQCKLSVQVLGLGVRILADAPLWPLAMGFAEAFKNVAIHNKD